ncbi:hypothetical protein [Asticcacaulis sp.]|uniref:hypothetical protein n=1 Tax=Asticcacaulis sp. TaxID=1872648 RepID=UPI00261E5358|nr:hypothetical protein [Asticcacaulis sp.]
MLQFFLIFGVFVTYSSRAVNYSLDYHIINSKTWISFLLMAAVVILLVMFERMVKIGEIYFVEISDQHLWDEDDIEDLRFEYRVSLRKFSVSRDLPIAPGKIGIPLYFLFNFTIMVLSSLF